MTYYRKLQGTINSPEIVVLHGLTCNKYVALEWGKYFHKRGYTVHGLTANGHGNQPGKIYSWLPTVNKYTKYIKSLKKRVVVIGHSMGATEALGLARISNVSQVFVLSGLHDQSPFIYPNLAQTFFSGVSKIRDDLQGEPITPENLNRVMRYITPILPINITLTPDQAEKIYLVHHKVDPIIPFKHFERNKQKFHIPKSRCLVLNSVGHMSTPHRLKVKSFILEQIEKKRKG